MRTIMLVRSLVVVFALATIIAPASAKGSGAPHNVRSRQAQALTKSKHGVAASKVSACLPCDAARSSKNVKQYARKGARSAQKVGCHPKGYVDPRVAKKYNAAMRELKREGIKPQVTSAWRSSQHQASLHKCSLSSRCRRAHPGLYFAKPAGQSLHEAGFAVDISGVAAGPRGNKRLTPRGRRIVSVMQKNGFRWRYGLADPAHFEADPRKNGYTSVKAAIRKSQNSCSVKTLASGKAGRTSIKPAVKGSNRSVASSRAKSRTHGG